MDVDDDIEFDFFEDEPPTTEAPPPRVRLPGRGGGGRPGRPGRHRPGPSRPVAPLLRLLLLIALVIFLVVVFGLLIQSCASASKHDSYASYMTQVTKIGSQSAANGKALASDLTTPGLSVTAIETKLRGIADQEQQNVVAAESLDPPGPLRDINLHVIESLELRVAGVQGLVTAFQQTAKSTDTTTAAAALADQGERLIASDVVWDDLFKTPAIQELEHDGVSGVTVPESHYVASADSLSAQSMTYVLQRIQGAATTGSGTVSGQHGDDLVSVTAQPGGQVLSLSNVTTVTSTTGLSFDVVVHNGGSFQEVHVGVTMTIPQATGGPLTKTQYIASINPDEDTTVTFNPNDVGEVPFSQAVTIKVDIAGVQGEVNLSNNTGSYQVIFSL